MVPNEAPPPPQPADNQSQAPPSDMIPRILGIETASERNPFTIVGSTIVAGPDFIHLVSQAEGDGLGRKKLEMRELLENIAQGKATLDDLRVLSGKYATEQKYPSGPLNDLQSAAEAVRFMGRTVYLESQARGIAFPGIWKKIVLLKGQPYAICALNKPQNDPFQTLGGVKKGQTDIPRYSGGVLDGYNADCNYETVEHKNMGPLSTRLAAIVDSTRTKAFEDIMKNPQEIDVGIQQNENFPDGRLYTIVRKKELQVATSSA